MVKSIVRDPAFLEEKSVTATREDLPLAEDLYDTLKAHRLHCAGMAPNMIGHRKAIIAVQNGARILVMLNPELIMKGGPYEAEEGCLSLDGQRKALRYQHITVKYLDMKMEPQVGMFSGMVAQAIQHEMDHVQGILI